MVTVFLLLALFGIKHFLADFVLQNEYKINEKGTYGAAGGIHHALDHLVLTVLILAFFTEFAGLLALLDGIVHYHIDWAKNQLNRNLTANDRMWWVYFGLDQTLHYLTYIGIIYYVTVS